MAERCVIKPSEEIGRKNSGFLRHRSVGPVESRETLMPAETRAAGSFYVWFPSCVPHAHVNPLRCVAAAAPSLQVDRPFREILLCYRIRI